MPLGDEYIQCTVFLYTSEEDATSSPHRRVLPAVRASVTTDPSELDAILESGYLTPRNKQAVLSWAGDRMDATTHLIFTDLVNEFASVYYRLQIVPDE